MQMNSIRESQTRDSIINEIGLMLNSDFDNEFIHLIVEGTDDLLFFNGRLTQNVCMYESFSGKLGVHDIVQHFNHHDVIGVCDRDYDVTVTHNVYCYDYSCLEAMLYSCDKAFANVKNVLFRGSESLADIYKLIIANLSWLSQFRKISCHHNWGVRFVGIPFGVIFDARIKCLKKCVLLERLKIVNSNIRTFSLYLAVVEAEFATNISHLDFMNIVNGHDLLAYLSCVFRKGFGNDGISSKDIFLNLLCSYRFEDFSSSQLYHNLAVHGNKLGKRIVN